MEILGGGKLRLCSLSEFPELVTDLNFLNIYDDGVMYIMTKKDSLAIKTACSTYNSKLSHFKTIWLISDRRFE